MAGPNDREPGSDIDQLVPIMGVGSDSPAVAQIRDRAAHEQKGLIGHLATRSRHELSE